MSINGANRLGSNSLPELLVFGARAGRAAAEYASRAAGRPARPCWPRPRTSSGGWRREFLQQDRRRASGSPTLRDEMQKTMEEGAGIYRTGESLARAADKLRELQERVARRRASTITAGRSTPSCSPLWSWRSCSTWPRRSSTRALRREESRGAHQRTDFPGARRPAVPRALAGLPRARRLGAGSSTCR